jgi:hypothetical protein
MISVCMALRIGALSDIAISLYPVSGWQKWDGD